MFASWLKSRGGGQTINSSQKRRQSYLRRKKLGAVLIEFAFAIPVFLVLIYYIHDLPKYKLMKRKMQFTSNIMAATIQNISKQKAGTSKPAITQSDLINAMRLAFLTVYPGNTMLGTAAHYFQLGYGSHTFLYYIDGTGTNQAQVKWMAYTYCNSPSVIGGVEYKQHGRSSVKYASGATSNIYPNLTINNGDKKMILECQLFYPSIENGYYFSPNNPRHGGQSTKNVPPREAFGFLMLNPQCHDAHTWESNYFYGVTIFTPIGSAFSETAPQ